MIGYNKEFEKWNPNTAIGADLDAIGELCGLVRKRGRFWPESDSNFRKTILEYLKGLKENHLLMITREGSVADNYGEHF